MSSLRLQPSTYGNSNLIIEKLVSEAIEIHSVKMNYIPRVLVGKDMILGEDRLSEFQDAYPIEVYLETVDGFEGQGFFMQKFGQTAEQSATIQISRRSWDLAVARYGRATLPNRPTEGDLLYFPMTGGLFEMMFVNHQNPFYQLGQSYVFKCTIELFRYSSERINTGVEAIDAFEDLKSHDVTVNPDLDIPPQNADNQKFLDRGQELIFNTNNPFGEVL